MQIRGMRCDRCGKEVVDAPMPPGWVQITASQQHNIMFHVVAEDDALKCVRNLNRVRYDFCDANCLREFALGMNPAPPKEAK